MRPPKRAIAFLRWFCREDCIEEIEGDLLEVFKKEYAASPRKACWKFTWRVIRYFRPTFIKPLKNSDRPTSFGMYKSYFKIGWRNLLHNKAYSLINIGGLAIGMAFALLIGLWIQYELSFDSFHTNGDRIALVMKNTLFNDEKNTYEGTPFPLHEELKKNYAEVERASKVSWQYERSFTVANKTILQTGIYVDPDFLEMFSFRLTKGNISSALTDPNSIILTESFAKAMFGDEDPMGKVIRVDNEYDVQVTGVMENVPPNSTLQFSYLAAYEFEVKHSDFVRNNQTNWGNNFLMNMVELKKGVSMEAFSEKISKLNMERSDKIRNQYLFLHPLKKWRLENDHKNWVNTGGRIEYVRLFGVIGVFVLLIACVNFMNLSTARSQKRAKEVGIRKTIGSLRQQIIGQFLSESMLTSGIAFLFSLGLIAIILPYIKDIGFDHIRLSPDNSFLIVLGFIVCIGAGLIAGSYPAFYLSSFLPASILRGTLRAGKGPVAFRRVLVVSQFAISIGLILSTVAVFQQVDHAKSRPLGYNPENVISVAASKELYKNFQPLKQALLSSGYIAAVAQASSPMTDVYNRWSDFSWEGKEPGSDIALDVLMTEWDLDKVAQLNFRMGRPFSIEHPTDSNAVILNASALKIIGYKDPIGRTMKAGDRDVTIVGVIDDILMRDPFKSTSPGVILFNAEVVNNILVRLKDGDDPQKALAAIDPIFRKHNASQPFVCSFVSEDFNGKFALENQIGKLSAIFAGLAIFISCLGLLGLTSFMAEQRIKEIGIRKILGASVINLWHLLSKELILLIALSFVIASPIVYYGVDSWLQHYQYRATLSLWTFVIVGVGVMVVALGTVSYQSLKAVLTNPVKNLRAE